MAIEGLFSWTVFRPDCSSNDNVSEQITSSSQIPSRRHQHQFLLQQNTSITDNTKHQQLSIGLQYWEETVSTHSFHKTKTSRLLENRDYRIFVTKHQAFVRIDNQEQPVRICQISQVGKTIDFSSFIRLQSNK